MQPTQIQRPIMVQPITHYALTVGAVPTPINANPALIQGYISSFIISVPTAAANPVYWGDQQVSVANGIELVAGVLYQFEIINERQLYELQHPAIDSARMLTCSAVPTYAIPFVTWDLSQLYLIAVAPTDVRLMFFKSAYV